MAEPVKTFKIERSNKLESQARKLFAYEKRDEFACGFITAVNQESQFEAWFLSYVNKKLDGDIKQLDSRMTGKQDTMFLKLRKQGVSEAEAHKIAYGRPMQVAGTDVVKGN